MAQKILTIGEILVEIMATSPGEGFRAPMALVGPFPSGAPAIFIDQVARLGHPCAIVGAVGSDDFGQMTVDRLRADGVDVSAIRIDADAVTGTAFVRYRPDGGRDFVFNIVGSAAAKVQMTAEARSVIESAGHLHVVGSSLTSPAIVRMVEEAIAAVKARGGSVSFDPNVRKEIFGGSDGGGILSRVLAQTDLFLPSGDELLLFSGADSPDGAMGEILDRGVSAIVHKLGAEGARYVDREIDLRLPGFPMAETDPTGAGDIFGATFVVGWLEGGSPEQTLRRANAAGALAIAQRGPMEGSSSSEEIERFLARHSSPDGASRADR